jgi:hypothetical protein
MFSSQSHTIYALIHRSLSLSLSDQRNKPPSLSLSIETLASKKPFIDFGILK